jgi:ATP-dependent exoDNAse (exonuclease V) beta subunit
MKIFNHLTPIEIPALEQVNTETGRYYKSASGNLYPSVTTVTGLMNAESIRKWRKRVGDEEANKISSRAARRGTRIHEICEHYVANSFNPANYNIMDIDNFNPLRRVIDEHIDNVHLQEKRLYSDFLMMAGTVDCIAEFAGKLSIIDFKTARRAKEREYILNYFCQATAYAIMYEELTQIPVPNIVILICVDDDEPQIFTGKRNDYVKPLLEIRKKYKEIYNV